MKTIYSNLLSIIKTIICLTILLTINNEPAQSSSFFDQIKNKTKSVTDTVSKSLEDQRKNAEIYYSESFDKLGIYTSEVVTGAGELFENFMDEFETKGIIFENAGFHLSNAKLYITLIPAVSFTFKNGKLLDDKKYTELQNSLSDNPALKELFEILVSMRKKFKTDKYFPATTTVKFGVPPSVHLSFPLDNK